MSPQPQSSVPDVVAPGLRVLFCGINPGRASAAAGAHFANPRNDFWRLLAAAEFTPRLLEPQEQFSLLEYGIGVTNAALRTTPGSGDLRRSDFAGSAERLDRMANELRPAWIAFVGKEAYRGAFRERAALGDLGRRLGTTRLFVLPSTSPANAAVSWEDRLRWFGELSRLSAPRPRPSVRAIILDDEGRVLLHHVPGWTPPVWVGPGGAVEPGESDEDAIRREVREEVGLEVLELGPQLWLRGPHIWSWQGEIYESTERLYLTRVEKGSLRVHPADAQARWWTLEELESTGDLISPRRLPTLLRALHQHGPPAAPVDVGI
jgi:TDG/mug DNA glycosylase family protein